MMSCSDAIRIAHINLNEHISAQRGKAIVRMFTVLGAADLPKD